MNLKSYIGSFRKYLKERTTLEERRKEYRKQWYESKIEPSMHWDRAYDYLVKCQNELYSKYGNGYVVLFEDNVISFEKSYEDAYVFATLYAERENIQFDDVAFFKIGENHKYAQFEGNVVPTMPTATWLRRDASPPQENQSPI